MNNNLLIILLLAPALSFGQYTRHYKEPKKLSKGAIITLGGITFTAVPIIAEVTSSTTPFRNDPNTKGFNLTPNKFALVCGVTVTIIGLITLISEQ